MIKKIKLLFISIVVLIFIFFTVKELIDHNKRYTSTIDHYNSHIEHIDRVQISFHTSILKDVINIEASLDANELLGHIRNSISNSIEDRRVQRMYDYMGYMALENNGNRKITISIFTDQNSEVVWFKIHKNDDAYGIFYKYLDGDLYWFTLMNKLIEYEIGHNDK